MIDSKHLVEDYLSKNAWAVEVKVYGRAETLYQVD